MKAVILVGGEGTRLRPLTVHRPKSLVPVAGRPFLEYPLRLLRQHGIREVVLSVCHQPDRIRRQFGNGGRFGLRLRYAQETKPLGTAGAIKNAEPFLRLGDGEPLLVLNGDVLTDLDLTRLVAAQRRLRARAAIALTRVADPSAYGLVQYDRTGRVLKFLEKPGPGTNLPPWINAGAYVFTPEVLARIPAGRRYSTERELFPGLLARRERLCAVPSHAYWRDIGTISSYLQANQDVLAGRMFHLPGSERRGGTGIWTGRLCRRHAGAKLCAPVLLGRECVIERGASVGEGSVLGDRVRVGRGAVVRHSVLWDDVTVGEGARLEGCVLADRCRLGRFVHIRPGTALGRDACVPDYSRL